MSHYKVVCSHSFLFSLIIVFCYCLKSFSELSEMIAAHLTSWEHMDTLLFLFMLLQTRSQFMPPMHAHFSAPWTTANASANAKFAATNATSATYTRNTLASNACEHGKDTLPRQVGLGRQLGVTAGPTKAPQEPGNTPGLTQLPTPGLRPVVMLATLTLLHRPAKGRLCSSHTYPQMVLRATTTCYQNGCVAT